MIDDSNGLPILEQFGEEGFVDCVLRIVSLTEIQSHYVMTLRASHQGEPVGLEVKVVKGIQSGLDADAKLIQQHVYRKGVVFRSIGKESDRLLRLLAALYGLEDLEGRMVQSESFTAIALHQGDIDLRSQPVKLKLFGRDEDPASTEVYNESYFNLDLVGGHVYWNEKDQEYRRPLIRALSQ